MTVLRLDEFAYLGNLLVSRRCPAASRLDYALATRVDAHTSELKECLDQELPDAYINVKMFYGAIVRVKQCELEPFQAEAKCMVQKRNVSFIIEVFQQ